MATTTDLRTLMLTKFGVQQPGDPPALLNHPTQSATAIDGWKSALFGVPFLTVGFFIGRAALNQVDSPKSAPVWVIGIFAGMFFFGGLFFFVHGLRGIARKAAWKRAAARMPSAPWLYDFHWHREGIAYSALDEMVKRLLGALVWNAFVLLFAWIGMQGPWPFLIGAAIFGLLGLIFWYRWWTMLLDLLRYGNSYLSYEGFPYSLGGPLHAQLRPPRHVSEIGAHVDVALRPGKVRHHQGRGQPQPNAGRLLRALQRRRDARPRPARQPRDRPDSGRIPGAP